MTQMPKTIKKSPASHKHRVTEQKTQAATPRRGRPPELLHVVGDWEAAVKTALAKGKPPAEPAKNRKAQGKKKGRKK